MQKPIPIPRAKEILDAKATIGKIVGKARKLASMASDECQEKEKGDPKGTEGGKEGFNSLNTAYEPEIVLHNVTSERHTTFVFLELLLKLRVLEVE